MALAAAASAFEWRRVKLQTSLLYTFARDVTRTLNGAADDLGRWTPTVVATYRPLRDIDLNVRAFYKRIFRMPTMNDLYYVQVGNKDLAPEYTTQYDVGIVYGKTFGLGALRKIEAQVDGYFNRVENKIIAIPTDNQFRWTMTNLGLVKIRGVDVAAAAEFLFGEVSLSARLNYTWQRAQDFTPPERPGGPPRSYYGHQIPYIPRHSGSAVAGVRWRSWSLNYSFIGFRQ